MAARSPPIDIVMSSNRQTSSSPGNKTSNLTSALRANSTSPQEPMEPDKPIQIDNKPYPPRQDSIGFGVGTPNSGSKPISVAGKSRRESNFGSYMGGVSWGGASVGSFLQDDIMMGGMSPNLNSPSFHSSSYLPKMEANFWSNLKCCDTTFNDLHELVAHFEDVHKQAPATFPYKMSMSGTAPFTRRKSSTVNPAEQMRPMTQTRGFQPVSDGKPNGVPTSRLQPSVLDNDNRKPSMSGLQDMETIGEMEMDDGQTNTDFSQFPQPQNNFSSQSTPRMATANPAFPDMVSGQQRFPTSTSSSPPGPQPNNPVISSVNTPNFTASPNRGFQQNMNSQTLNPIQTQTEPTIPPQFTSNAVPFNSQMLQRLNNEFGNLDFGNNNEMLDLCINEPAKNLYSADGGFNSQQYPHFGFTNGQSNTNNNNNININNNSNMDNSDENAKKLQAQRLASGASRMQTEEERPFKCPVIGCEKAYKNANGLRYHEKHGHSTQKLKDNGDGTFSIVDPVTEMPYPGTVGMEKEKPYRCEVCGKRYKNLNGLKYHRNHSPPCNPEFSGNSDGALELDGEGEPDDVDGDDEVY